MPQVEEAVVKLVENRCKPLDQMGNLVQIVFECDEPEPLERMAVKHAAIAEAQRLGFANGGINDFPVIGPVSLETDEYLRDRSHTVKCYRATFNIHRGI